jgi:hypothetical protein
VSEAVRSHRPISIKRRDELAVLIGAADLDAILAACEFRPEVFFEDDAVSIWLPEFMLYGRGRTYDSAVEDLVEEVRAYVADYPSGRLRISTHEQKRSVPVRRASTGRRRSAGSASSTGGRSSRRCEEAKAITRDTRDGCPTGRSCGRAHPIATNR